MSKRGLGSLADLAQIIEEASNPDSELREDRRESKPKLPPQTVSSRTKARLVDPKRKAWHDRRLKEQERKASQQAVAGACDTRSVPLPEAARAAAVSLGGSLLATLTAVKEAKPKTEGKQRTESWRRKPGEPVF